MNKTFPNNPMATCDGCGKKYDIDELDGNGLCGNCRWTQVASKIGYKDHEYMVDRGDTR